MKTFKEILTEQTKNVPMIKNDKKIEKLYKQIKSSKRPSEHFMYAKTKDGDKIHISQFSMKNLFMNIDPELAKYGTLALVQYKNKEYYTQWDDNFKTWMRSTLPPYLEKQYHAGSWVNYVS